MMRVSEREGRRAKEGGERIHIVISQQKTELKGK
jgi:hypothetical protein